MVDNHFKEFLESVIVSLYQDQDLDYEVLGAQMQTFKLQMNALQSTFQTSVPPGGENLQAGMLAVLEHYQSALSYLQTYLDEMDEELLKTAYLESQAGNDLAQDLFEELQRSAEGPQVFG